MIWLIKREHISRFKIVMVIKSFLNFEINLMQKKNKNKRFFISSISHKFES